MESNSYELRGSSTGNVGTVNVEAATIGEN